MKQLTAFTLIELLITISILCLLFTIALPSYQNIIERDHAQTTLIQLYKAIQLAKSEAIKYRCLVTLCPTQDGMHCSNNEDWNMGYMIFIDSKENGIPINSDQIIKRFQPITKNAKLIWKSFRNQNFLQMTPLGFTNYQNGTFTYYSTNHRISFINALLINQSGRVRFSKNKN